MGDMTAVMGNRQDALEVGKQAMDRVARSPYVSAVPQCYPVPLKQQFHLSYSWSNQMGQKFGRLSDFLKIASKR